MYGPSRQLEDGELVDSEMTSDKVITLQPLQQWFQGFSFRLHSNHTSEAAPAFVEPLIDIISHRYGFDWDPNESGGHYLKPNKDSWKANAANILQDSKSLVHDEYMTPIVRFIAALLQHSVATLPPSMLWDLHPDAWHSLRNSFDFYYIFNRYDLEDKIVYTLTPRPHLEDNGDWIIAFNSATTVLQCIRATRSMNDAVRYLLQRGVPFNTFLPRSILEARCPTRRYPTSSVDRHIGLGERRTGYVPGAADYEAYEISRDEFLRCPRARAALLKGGIVWRLVMEFLEPGLVLAGPSDDALTHGQSFRPTAGGPEYSDDDLTSDELDLICGVYQVRTGNLHLLGCFFLVLITNFYRLWRSGVTPLVVAQTCNVGEKPVQRRLLDSLC
jgi:hypothetical protein